MRNMNNFLATKISNFKAETVLYFILALPALFLLVNHYPYFLILSILAVIFMGFIFFLYKKQITAYHYPVLILLTLIYAYFITSYFLSGQYVSNFLSYRFLRTDGNFFFCYILFFIFSVPFFNYRKAVNYYFRFLFISFSIFSVLGIVEYVSGYSEFMTTVDPTAGKIFHALNFAHNATGSVYALVSIFALVFFLKEKIRKKKILYLAIFALCVIALLLTKSRGSYLAFAAGLIFVFWMHFRSVKKVLLYLLGLIVISIPVLWITKTYERILQIFQTGGTAAVRLELWEKAWNLFSQSPLFGIGFARFNDIQSVTSERLAGLRGIWTVYLNPRFYFDFSNAHNSYLQFLAEGGIIGLGLILMFWFLCFGILWKALKLFRYNDFSSKVFLSALSSIVILFILSLTENYFSATTIMVAVSMIVSLAIGLYWQNREELN